MNEGVFIAIGGLIGFAIYHVQMMVLMAYSKHKERCKCDVCDYKKSG
jgi:hypothetical protein